MMENGGAVPRMNMSLSVAERERLQRLARSLGVRPSRAVAIAVAHCLETLSRGEPLHVEVEPQREADEQ